MKLEKKMFTISSYIPFTKPYYIRQCVVGKRSHFKDILEIGCGTGRHMSYLRKWLREDSLTVGLDIWPLYLKLSKQNRIHDELILGDACHLPFKEKSFDLVLALDLLEHIPKEKGIELLNDVEKVARKRLVLSLPIGWHPSHHQGNPYDEHVSAWTVKELRDRGYQIYTFYIRGTGGNSSRIESLSI
jgi:ubiquinone/menaquinone biosynthesis C-methylase UbiE